MKIYSYSSNSKKPKLRLKSRFFKNWTWKKTFTLTFRLAAAGIIIAAGLFLYYTQGLPDPGKLLEREVPQSTKIYARDNSLLYEIHGEVKRTLVDIDQISPNLQNATVSVEDKNFYKEGGISIKGILRSIVVDITTGKKTQGGSTITQQFVKNALLTKDKAWDRKIREVFLAIAIDARFSKKEILKFYLNEIPYGRNAYGAEAAAQAYFGKHASEINLAESAYLASIPKSTTYYNPNGPHRDALDARKNTVLQLMKDQGYINEDQMKEAQNEKVVFANAATGIHAPHFVFWVEDYLAEKYGEQTLLEGGLQVYTTLDPHLQEIAEKAVADGISKESKKYSVNNAALVAIDPKTGQVLAMVGSKDYFGTPEPAGCTPGKNCTYEPNVNVAVSERQPGSSFKPYVYVTAFGKQFKYTPASPLFDVTTNFGTFGGKSYIPHNYSGESNGLVSMRKALAGSLNIPAVKTLDLVGVDNATKTAHDLGITSPLKDCGLSLVLGGCEVTLLDHVASYSVFANSGVRNSQTPILKIQDSQGRVLEEFQSHPQQVIDPQANYELISIMTDNNARSYIFGSNSPLILPNRIVAAKTGTTNRWHDGWTLGFTPSLAAGVWAGNNDGTLLKPGADGVLVAAPIWNAFMKAALASSSPEEFSVPSGIKNVVVDNDSGMLPTNFSPSTHSDVFADYSVPTSYDDMHTSISIDSFTGLPSTPQTPPGQVLTKTCTIYHSEKPNNPNWEQPVLEWALSQPDSCPSNLEGGGVQLPLGDGSGPRVNILDPGDGAFISNLPIQLNITANSPNEIARIEISIDGKFYQSLTSLPYSIQLNTPLSDGDHVIAVKAIDNAGLSADTSTIFTYSSGGPVSQ